jgi:outer membrane protein
MISIEKTLVSFLLFFSVQWINGQETIWNLQKCINVGLENNISIKIQQLEVKRSYKAKLSMVNEMLPSVNLFGSQSYNFGSTIDPGTNGRVSSNIQYDNFYLNAQMNLLDFGAIANTQKTKLNVEIAKAEQEIIENEYKLQILDSYFRALFTQELVKIEEQQLENTRNNLERITKEVEIGSKTKSDLYDIQLNFSKDEKRIIESKQLSVIQKTQLFQLLNYPGLQIENIQLETELIQIESLDSEITNPKIKAAKLVFEKDKKEVRFQQANKLPSLSTFYQFSSFYYKPLNQPEILVDDFNNQLNNNKNQQVGLQLTIPVFNGFKNNKNSSAAKIEVEKSNYKIEVENLKITQQLELEEKNKDNYLYLQKKLVEVANFAKASFITTQAKFISGKIDVFSYSAAQYNLLTSKYDELKNSLLIQFTTYKINLIRSNSL